MPVLPDGEPPGLRDGGALRVSGAGHARLERAEAGDKADPAASSAPTAAAPVRRRPPTTVSAAPACAVDVWVSG